MGRLTTVYCDVCCRELGRNEEYIVMGFSSSKWKVDSSQGIYLEHNSFLICEDHKNEKTISIKFEPWNIKK